MTRTERYLIAAGYGALCSGLFMLVGVLFALITSDEVYNDYWPALCFFLGGAAVAGYYALPGWMTGLRLVSTSSVVDDSSVESGPQVRSVVEPGTLESVEERVVEMVAGVYDNEPNDNYRRLAEPVMAEVNRMLAPRRVQVVDPEYLEQLYEQRRAAHKEIKSCIEGNHQALVDAQRREVDRINGLIHEQLTGQKPGAGGNGGESRGTGSLSRVRSY